jgi:hypothetical protein
MAFMIRLKLAARGFEQLSLNVWTHNGVTLLIQESSVVRVDQIGRRKDSSHKAVLAALEGAS